MVDTKYFEPFSAVFLFGGLELPRARQDFLSQTKPNVKALGVNQRGQNAMATFEILAIYVSS